MMPLYYRYADVDIAFLWCIHKKLHFLQLSGVRMFILSIFFCHVLYMSMRYWRIAGSTASDVPSVTSHKYGMITIPWIQDGWKGRKDKQLNSFSCKMKFFVVFPAGGSWKPYHARAKIRWSDKVYGQFPCQCNNVAVFKLWNIADVFKLLQGNAGKLEGFEWRWKQAKVKSFPCYFLKGKQIQMEYKNFNLMTLYSSY